MEELEVPTEHVQEELHHHAVHSGERWVSQVALTAALFAVLAAIAALLAGHHSNEAVIEQIRAADKWSYFQSKGIKLDVLESRLAMMDALGKPPPLADVQRQAKLNADKQASEDEAKKLESSSERHLSIHNHLARSVTLFQVTIAIGAISVLTRQRRFWLFSLVTGVIGIVFFGLSFFPA